MKNNTRDASSQTPDVLPSPKPPQQQLPMPRKKRLVASSDFHILRGFEDAWPQRTNVHCWHCAHGFDTPPIGIPVHKSDEAPYELYGVFCSFACMKTFNATRPSHERAVSGQLIHEMLRDVYGVVDVVGKAPPKQMLQKFGGLMSIEEFRQSSATKTINIITPPLMAVKTFYEEIPTVSKTAAFQTSKTFANTSAPLLPNQMKKVDVTSADNNEDGLCLKRPRTAASKASLDCFMSIKRGN